MAEYVCGECGAQIALADARCLGCGSAHPYAVEEKPIDDPETGWFRGAFGFWALGAVFALGVAAVALTTVSPAG